MVAVLAALVIGILGVAIYWSQWFEPDDPPVEEPQRQHRRRFARRSRSGIVRCPEMIALPAGTFMMGSPADERGRSNVEGTSRSVTIRKSFALGRFEVTVGEFSAFMSVDRHVGR